MKITLTQTDIVAAIKLHLQSQGISTAGKNTSVAFTATRKAEGLIAEITIEDADAPAQVSIAAAAINKAKVAAENPAIPDLPVAEPDSKQEGVKVAEAAAIAEPATPAEPEVVTEAEPTATEAAKVSDTPAAAPKSLFS